MQQPAVYQRQVTVNLENGLHMRPLSRIFKIAQTFQCAVKLRNGEKVADASSLLDLMTLGAECGAILMLEATGDQAPQALEALAELFDTNFAGDPEPN